jgi:hypothetical protein
MGGLDMIINELQQYESIYVKWNCYNGILSMEEKRIRELEKEIRWLAKENEIFAKAYREKHLGSFEKYSGYEDETVIVVTVKSVRQWRYENGQPIMAEAVFA